MSVSVYVCTFVAELAGIGAGPRDGEAGRREELFHSGLHF